MPPLFLEERWLTSDTAPAIYGRRPVKRSTRTKALTVRTSKSKGSRRTDQHYKSRRDRNCFPRLWRSVSCPPPRLLTKPFGGLNLAPGASLSVTSTVSDREKECSISPAPIRGSIRPVCASNGCHHSITAPPSSVMKLRRRIAFVKPHPRRNLPHRGVIAGYVRYTAAIRIYDGRLSSSLGAT
jgi:hypothetical protein